MVKRYFPYLALFGAAAVIISSFFLSAPVKAEPVPDRDFYSMIATADDLAVFHLLATPAVIALREVGDIKPHQLAIREPRPLAPEYAESLRTDAHNFIETRMRC